MTNTLFCPTSPCRRQTVVKTTYRSLFLAAYFSLIVGQLIFTYELSSIIYDKIEISIYLLILPC